MHESIHQALNAIYPITESDFEALTKSFRSRTYKKGEVIVAPGQVQKDLLFVVQGTQMSYIEGDDHLHVIAFTYPPGICAIPESFCFQQPSRYFLRCISESSFYTVTFSSLQNVFDTSQKIERLFRIMTEHVLAGVIERHIDLHTLSIEDRFRKFCKRSGHLLQIVPHKYIASYLNIDPTNFSKLYNTVRI